MRRENIAGAATDKAAIITGSVGPLALRGEGREGSEKQLIRQRRELPEEYQGPSALRREQPPSIREELPSIASIIESLPIQKEKKDTKKIPISDTTTPEVSIDKLEWTPIYSGGYAGEGYAGEGYAGGGYVDGGGGYVVVGNQKISYDLLIIGGLALATVYLLTKSKKG